MPVLSGVEGLGAVLGWKFNHEPGISTIEDNIVGWPLTLGPAPTSAQIAAWTAEYETDLAQRTNEKQQRLDRIQEILMLSRTTWTNAQFRELLELVAQEIPSPLLS